MAQVKLAPELIEDFDRILAHLELHRIADGRARIVEIMHAIDVLAHNPLIGRSVANGKRELVIGRRGQGYLALYHYAEAIDTVFVLAVRSQREAGYARQAH